MKKILMVFLVLAVLLIAGVSIFLLTFDVNRFRPFIIQKIEETLGGQAKLGGLSLGWRGGVAFEVKNLSVYPKNALNNSEPSLHFDRASAVVDLAPLLQKNIEVSSVLLTRPSVILERKPDGSVYLAGLEPKKREEKAQAPAAETKEAEFVFSVNSFRIKDGNVDFYDPINNKPKHLSIRALDLTVTSFSLKKPFSFEAKAAIFSGQQNIFLDGHFRLPQGNKPAVLRDFSVKTDLSGLDLRELSETFPDFGKAGIRHLAGNLQINIDELGFVNNIAREFAIRAALTKGRLALNNIPSSFEDVTTDFLVEGDRATIRNFSAGFAKGTIKIAGVVNGLSAPSPQLTLKAALENLSLQTLAPKTSAQGPEVAGRLSIFFEGGASGMGWPEISRTLSGQGRLLLNEGAILNFNLLREVFSRLSMIPGAQEKLNAGLPQNYQAKLNDRNTILQPMDVPFVINQGSLFFDNLQIATDYSVLNGRGRVGLDGAVEIGSVLRISPELSDASARSVNELQYLMNQRGELEMPLQIQGNLPNVKILPDMNYIGQKVLATKGQELISNLLTKSQKGVAEGSQELSAKDNLLGSLLGKFQ